MAKKQKKNKVSSKKSKNISSLSEKKLNATLVKCPKPQNFRSGKVSLSADEVFEVTTGLYSKLTVLKYGSDGEILFTTDITESMINSIEDKGRYFLMSTR